MLRFLCPIQLLGIYTILCNRCMVSPPLSPAPLCDTTRGCPLRWSEAKAAEIHGTQVMVTEIQAPTRSDLLGLAMPEPFKVAAPLSSSIFIIPCSCAEAYAAMLAICVHISEKKGKLTWIYTISEWNLFLVTSFRNQFQTLLLGLIFHAILILIYACIKWRPCQDLVYLLIHIVPHVR